MTREQVVKIILEETDPLIKQKFKDLLEKMDFFRKEEMPLIEELNSIGIQVESVWDLVNNQTHPMLMSSSTGDYAIAYPVLLKHLDFEYHPRIKEGIIRALTEKKASEIATEKILQLFYKETNKNIKWALANALRTLMTWQKRKKYPEIKEVLYRK